MGSRGARTERGPHVRCEPIAPRVHFGPVASTCSRCSADLHVHRTPSCAPPWRPATRFTPMATCEAGRAGLFLCLDGFRGWVLAAARIPTGREASLCPFIGKTVALFGHPEVRAPNGVILAVVSRVNKVPEHFFGQEKQLLRRRVGRAHLGRDMEQQPAQAAFVRNLRDPLYVQLLCGSLDQLPEAFADLDARNLVPPTSSLRDHRRATLRRIAHSVLNPAGTASPKSRSGPPHSRRMPTVL